MGSRFPRAFVITGLFDKVPQGPVLEYTLDRKIICKCHRHFWFSCCVFFGSGNGVVCFCYARGALPRQIRKIDRQSHFTPPDRRDINRQGRVRDHEWNASLHSAISF